MKDLYSLLGVSKSASDAEIKKAYRKLALRFHPDKVTDTNEESDQSFTGINEAYAILSNPELRGAYNKNGFEGLDKTKDSDDSKEVFDSFFGVDHPFASFGFHDTTNFRSRKKSVQHHDLPCSLEELCNGTEKVIKVTRKRYAASQKRCLDESTILKIQVDAGSSSGKQIVFKGEGDEEEGQHPADLVFTIKEEPRT